MRRFVTLLIATALSLTALVGPAQAAPPDIIGLDQLRTLLDANPDGIDGYFLTVPGGPSLSQQNPVKVGMRVLAVADKAGPDGSLIMFKADMSDPVMVNLGTIASGMSGSPLYLTDGGTDKVIGALSYGEEFALDGLGLATPIEYMLAAQEDFPPAASGVLGLDREVHLPGRTVSRVDITPSLEDAPPDRGTVAFRPLFGLQVSGVPQDSAAYRRFAARATAKGMQLLPGGSGPCSSAGYSAPYEPGGSLGAYYALGSAEVGGFGTVTYIDGDAVLGFGHPMDWAGRTDIFATNVWVSGIWGSAAAAHKVGCAGQTNGALTQDRSAGVGVDLAATTVSTPVTAQVAVRNGGTRSATGDTRVAQGAFSAGYGPEAVALGVSEPVYRAADQAALAGSARTTTTVRVTDGHQSFTVTRPDVWSGSDALGDASIDAATMVDTLLSVPGLGTRIESVDLQATIDTSSRSATIEAVRGGPLQVGQNTVTAILAPTGGAPVEVPVTLTVPDTASLDAGLVVDAGSTYSGGDIPAFDSLDAIVEWLEALPTNSELVFSMSDSNGNPLEVARARTDYYLQGSAYPGTVSGSLMADVPEAMLGDQVTLMAMPTGVPVGQPITFEQQTAGASTWQPVGTAPLVTGSDGSTAATVGVTPSQNTRYRASWAGDMNMLAWSASTDVSVAPPLEIDGTRRGKAWVLRISSAPQVSGQPVQVQARRDGSWRTVATATLGQDGSASVRWSTGPSAVTVRARLEPSAQFRGASSSRVTLSAAQLMIDAGIRANRRGNITVSLRTSKGHRITGVRYRVARSTGNGWDPAASGTLRKATRLWLANGDYRVTVPKQKGVAAQVREKTSITSVAVLITKATGGRGRARVQALPPVPLRFTVQKLQAGQWLPVGGVRRMAPPQMTWAQSLPAGRYRFAFGKQSGFDGAVSDPVRVR